MINFRKFLFIVFAFNVLVFSIGFFGLASNTAIAKESTCGICKNTADCEKDLECVENQCQDPSKITFCPASSKKQVEDLVNEVMKWIMIVGLVVTPLMIILGGFFILTSQGDSKRTTTGKNIIKWALIGLAIILFAKAFVSILKFLL